MPITALGATAGGEKPPNPEPLLLTHAEVHLKRSMDANLYKFFAFVWCAAPLWVCVPGSKLILCTLTLDLSLNKHAQYGSGFLQSLLTPGSYTNQRCTVHWSPLAGLFSHSCSFWDFSKPHPQTLSTHLLTHLFMVFISHPIAAKLVASGWLTIIIKHNSPEQ